MLSRTRSVISSVPITAASASFKNLITSSSFNGRPSSLKEQFWNDCFNSFLSVPDRENEDEVTAILGSDEKKISELLGTV